MTSIGAQLGILCVALAVLTSACTGSDAHPPNPGTPPAERPSRGPAPGEPGLGEGADRGADGL